VSAQSARISCESVPQALHVQDALLGQAAATVEAWGAPRRLLGKRAAHARHGGIPRRGHGHDWSEPLFEGSRTTCASGCASALRHLDRRLDHLTGWAALKALGLGRHRVGLVEREAPSGLSPSIGVVTRGYEPELSGRGDAVGQLGLH